MDAVEWQFDGIVGPTHNYAGLALGNLAATKNAGAISNPRAAALQGLAKMRFVRDLGVPQAVLPPHYRPLIGELKRLGFSGDLGMMLDTAYRQAPGILSALFSSAFMWAANAATVSPSADSRTGKLQITPANLVSNFHRSVESAFGHRALKMIFHNTKYNDIHNSLPAQEKFGDEGAANHMRIFCNNSNIKKNIFVYGRGHRSIQESRIFSARHTLLASETVARLHDLAPQETVFLQQNPVVIDKGVFHNDVIAMNTGTHMIIHEEAFIEEDQKIIQDLFAQNPDWRLHTVKSSDLSVEDSVSSYLFNSQYLQIGINKYVLVAPADCLNFANLRESGLIITTLKNEGLIDEIHYLDVHESMRNGGGPACLRLRIVMTPEQSGAMHQGVVLTDSLYQQLEEWITTHYRDSLTFDDLRDPYFVRELDEAYATLEPILGMPDLYAPWRIEI